MTTLVSREAMEVLEYGHGLFNAMIMLLFFYQAVLGYRIRRRRLGGGEPPVTAKGRHRRLGPILTVLAPWGFFAGVSLVLIESGDLFKYPLHLAGGVMVLLALAATFSLSRRIRGAQAGPRTAHFASGLALLFLYLMQSFLGLGALL